MRIRYTHLYARFIHAENEPTQLEVGVVGKKADLERLLQVIESECAKAP